MQPWQCCELVTAGLVDQIQGCLWKCGWGIWMGNNLSGVCPDEIPTSNGQYNLCMYLWLICVPRRLDMVSSRFCRRSAMFFTVLIRLVSGSSPEDTHFIRFTLMLWAHTHTYMHTLNHIGCTCTNTQQKKQWGNLTSSISLNVSECLTKGNRMMTGHNDSHVPKAHVDNLEAVQ